MPLEKSAMPWDDPQVEWRDGTIPVSRQFGDPYYAVTDGQEETRHVFVGGNDLPRRWPAMGNCLIAEIGFGTGLNFLETLRQWRDIRRPGAVLHYVAFELYPLSPPAMRHALARWPALAGLGTELVAAWQPQYEMTVIRFGRDAELSLFLSDAVTRLPQLRMKADAWYLDGFAPAKNPQVWSAPLMRHVFDRTRPGGTFATYTAAGWVRRNLQAAGFAVERAPGFATKREMLRGIRPV